MRVQLPLLGIIDIFFQDIKLEEFSRRQFFNYMREEKTVNFNSRYVTIITELNYDDYLMKYKKEKFQYSRNFRCENGNITYQGMFICQTECGKIKIELNMDKSLRLKAWQMICHKLRKENLYAHYHAEFYQTVLFPVFALYAIFGNYYLIHGSLIRYRKQYFIISGLDGVGKSSLTNMLVDKGAECLADNFVLFNGTETITLSLAMRLSPEMKTSMNIIYEDTNLKEVVLNNGICEKDKVVPQKIYVLCIADEIKVENVCVSKTDWVLFMNNAPEICDANKFIGPFLIAGIKNNESTPNVDITVIEIPYGQLECGRRIILNECQNVCTR